MTVNINGDKFITGTRDVLNLIAIFAAEAAEKYENENCPGLAKQANTVASEIHAALAVTDYYLY